MKDTQDIVESWRQQAVKEGVEQGIARGLAHAVVRIYEVRFGVMRADLRTAVEGTREGQVLDAWLGLAGSRGADEIAAAILAARASWTKERQARFDHLRAKNLAGPLTAAEEAELVALTAKVEGMEAQLLDRAIARLRGNVDALTQAVRDVESRREALARLLAQQQQLTADVRRFEAALEAVGNDLSPRVEELAQKSTEGQLTPEESQEYAEIVRLNDMLSLLKLQAQAFSTFRAAS